MGIAESLIRVSVGIEEVDDLVADFDQAFTKTQHTSPLEIFRYVPVTF
jgi:hypothetical protein